MADRYWVNGTGNWSNTARWSATPGGASGASVPVLTDNVIFDRAATYSVTLDAATRSCNNITVSAGTVTFVYTNILNIYGSLSYIAGVIHSGAASSTFRSTSTGQTITSNGTTFGNGIIFNGDGGGWTLGSSLTGGTCSVQAGTLTLNGFTLTSSTVGISNTLTKQINFGAANWVMTSTPMSCSTVDGFSWTGTGGIATAMTVQKTFTFGTTSGATSTNAINLTLTSGAGEARITTNSWFNIFDFSATTSAVNGIFATTTQPTLLNLNSIICPAGRGINGALIMRDTGNVTYNGPAVGLLTSFTVNHTGTTTLLAPLNVSSVTTTGTLNLTSGALNLNGQEVAARFFNGTGTTTRSIAFGTSSITLNGTTAAATYLDLRDMTNFTATGTGGFRAAADISRVFYCGSTSGGTSIGAPNLTFTAGATGMTIASGSWWNKLDFTGVTATPASSGVQNLNSLIMQSGSTYTGLLATMKGTGNVSSVGVVSSLGKLIIDHTGTTRLASNVSLLLSNGTTTLTSGNIDLNGFTLTTCNFISTGTSTRAIAFGTGSIALSNTAVAATNLDMADATNFTTTGTGGFTSAMSVARTFTFGTTGGSANNAPSLSLTSGASIPTITTGSYLNHLNFTGSTGIPAVTSLNLKSLTLASGVSYSNLTPTMVGEGTITSATNNTLPSLTINHSSGSVGNTTLAANLTLATNATTTLTSGNLVLAGFTLNNGVFNASGLTSRAIHFGTGKIALTHTTDATTVLNVANASNVTTTGTGGFTAAMSVARTFTFGTTGGTSTNAPSLTLTSGASIPTITTGSWFNTLDFTGTTSTPATTIVNVGTLTLATGGTYTSLTPAFTATQTWTPQFSKQLGGFGVNGTGITVTQGGVQSIIATGITTLTAGTLNLGGYDLTTGTFSSNNINPRSIVFGTNNIVLATTTAAATNLDMADATNFTTTGTGGFTSTADITRTFTFGTTGGSTINAPSLALTSGASIPTLTTGSWFNTLDFTGSTCTPAITSLNLNSLTLASGGTYTSLSPSMRGTGTITSNGKSLKALSFNSGVGTTTLNGNVSIITDGTNIIAGILALAGYTLNTNIFSSTSSEIRTITGGSGTINVTDYWQVSNSTNWASSNYTINMNSASAKSFQGAGGAYGILNQGGAGALTISGSNYFEAMTATTQPSSVIFTAGTTQYISTTTFFSGSAGALITLTSTTPTSAFTVSKASGTINSDYLDITDSIATGGATWNAGSHSIDTARNTGWIFTGGAPVYAVGGQFLAFFA